MIALYLMTPALGARSSRPVGFPIIVPDASLEEFVHRLTQEQIVVVHQFYASAPDETGLCLIEREIPVAITAQTVVTLRNYNHRVARVEIES